MTDRPDRMPTRPGPNRQLLFTLALIAAVIGFLQFKSSTAHFGLPNGVPAPLGAPGPDGGAAAGTLAEYRGEVLLIDFWATYCTTCAATVPALERLQTQYGAQGLRVVAVSLDEPADTARARLLLAEWGGTYPLIFDIDRALREAYQVNLLPMTYLISRDGLVAWQQAGTVGGAKYDLGLESPKGRTLLEKVLSE